MKKTAVTLLFVFLITFSCIFTSCNANQSIIPDQSEQQEQNNLAINLQELKNQILDIKQNQYISGAEIDSEIARLEQLIEDLKQSASTEKEDTKKDESTSPPDEEHDPPTTPPTSPQFIYTVQDGNATITEYVVDDETLTVPSSIDGYTVTCIADDAFSSNSLQSVILPETITKIGWFAFKNCTSLKTVTVTQNVTSIGYSAFPQNDKSFSLICPSGSFAAEYAKSYGISYTEI